METLSNSVLTVQIAEHGAELQSIKKDGKEYLWQGDAKFYLKGFLGSNKF